MVWWVRLGALSLVVACTGTEAVIPPPSSDGGSSGASGTSGSSGATGAKLAFVTEVLVDGKFGAAPGGLAGGDQLCTDEARAAGRGGTFRALLCVSGEATAQARLAAGPWKLHDGSDVPAKGAWGAASVLVNRSAGGAPQDGKVWTGCDDTGKPQENCKNWTTDDGSARVGEIGGVNTEWLSNAISGCAEKRRLYCFED